MEDVKFSPLSEYGDHMQAEEWLKWAKSGIFIPSDGSGYWATKSQESDVSVWKVRQKPVWATHVMWYNK